MYTVGRSAPRRFSPVGSLSHFRRQAQLPRFFQRQVRRAYSRSPPRISADSDPTPWPARPTRFSATGNPGGHERPALRLSVDPPFVSRHRRRRVGAVRRLLAGGHLHEREERRRRPEGRTGPVLCQMCKRPPAPKPTPAGFDWWRMHFSDTELPELGSGAMELTDAEAAALQGPSMPSPLRALPASRSRHHRLLACARYGSWRRSKPRSRARQRVRRLLGPLGGNLVREVNRSGDAAGVLAGHDRGALF
jgi:hypothetical protein